MEKKLDIFKVLEAASKKHSFRTVFTENDMKNVQPFVVMRWLSGCSSAQQIYFLNEIVNPYVYSLSKHKSLLCDLLTVCTIGKNQKYKWIPPSTGGKNFPQISDVIAKAFSCSLNEAYDMIVFFNDEEILSLADQLGYQLEDVAKIKKELRARSSK